MYIYFGTKDPLYDDGLRFFESIIDKGGECFFKNYKGIFHGVLSLIQLNSDPI